MRLLDAGLIHGLLPMADAVSLMRRAFLTISDGTASLAHRQALRLAGGTGLLMGAALDGQGLVAKLAAIMPANAASGRPGSSAMVVLMDEQTGAPLALLDGTALTAVRTAALNGCAIDVLARPEAEVALLVGCGTQAASQVLALDAVRDLREIRVLSRNPDHARAFTQRLADRVGARMKAVSEPASALEEVDIVLAATNSRRPVIPGSKVPAGCHVSGIGSFTPDMREFDGALLARARIFVESRETALAEAGELIAGAAAGVTASESWAELGEVLSGRRSGRVDPAEITFFKSVGHAVFDLLAARAIFDRAVAADAGQAWNPDGAS